MAWVHGGCSSHFGFIAEQQPGHVIFIRIPVLDKQGFFSHPLDLEPHFFIKVDGFQIGTQDGDFQPLNILFPGPLNGFFQQPGAHPLVLVLFQNPCLRTRGMPVVRIISTPDGNMARQLSVRFRYENVPVAVADLARVRIAARKQKVRTFLIQLVQQPKVSLMILRANFAYLQAPPPLLSTDPCLPTIIWSSYPVNSSLWWNLFPFWVGDWLDDDPLWPAGELLQENQPELS